MADGYVMHAPSERDDGLQLVPGLLDLVVQLERASRLVKGRGWLLRGIVRHGLRCVLSCGLRGIRQHVALRGCHDIRARLAQQRDVLHDDLPADVKGVRKLTAGYRRIG